MAKIREHRRTSYHVKSNSTARLDLSELQRVIASAGMLQRQAARRMGVALSTLARWEQGERVPTDAYISRMGEFSV